jgi:hypothetical protein
MIIATAAAVTTAQDTSQTASEQLYTHGTDSEAECCSGYALTGISVLHLHRKPSFCIVLVLAFDHR